jgi:flagellar hook assembly protein FlgD
MVNIHVFDSGGRKVYTIVNENAEQGHHEVNIDGSKLSNGIYYYLIETEYFIESRKMIRMK